jgi:hypothetical protein
MQQQCNIATRLLSFHVEKSVQGLTEPPGAQKDLFSSSSAPSGACPLSLELLVNPLHVTSEVAPILDLKIRIAVRKYIEAIFCLKMYNKRKLVGLLNIFCTLDI